MPIEHINKTETLNQGREKLNAAIDGANAADVTSKAADTKATQALANSESTQTQLDTIVIDGDSSVEAAQARVDEKGVPHPTLKARIDDGLNSVNQQLAENVEYLNQPRFEDSYATDLFDVVGFSKLNNTEYEFFSESYQDGVYYKLIKDPNDDYFKLGAGGVYLNRFFESTEYQLVGEGWVTGSSNYATTAGDKIVFTTNKPYFRVNTYVDNRGGLFDVYIDGRLKSQINTYSTESNFGNQTVIKTDGYHNQVVEIVFKGSHPAYPVENPRGWFNNLYIQDRTNDQIILHPTSNKEFAFHVTYNGNNFWLPEHNNIPVMENVIFNIRVDNQLIQFNELATGEVVAGNKIELSQQSDCIYQSTNIGEVEILYTLNIRGFIKYKGAFNPSVNLNVNAGYPLMLPVQSETLNKVVTSSGGQISVTGSNDEIYFEKDKKHAASALFTTNISGYGNIFAFATLDLYPESMLYNNDSINSDGSIFFWDRATVPKLYFQSMDNVDLTPNDQYLWGGYIGVGNSYRLASFRR